MNKTIKWMNYIIIPVILFIIAIYMGDFEKLEWMLSATVVVVATMCAYICNCNESLEADNNNNTEKINDLSMKITQMALYANGNTPYIIQVLFRYQTDDVVYSDTWYDIEIIVSTIQNQYGINYINISFMPEEVEIDRCINAQIDNSYDLLDINGKNRAGIKEYNFTIKESSVNKTTAKAVFRAKFINEGINSLNIEVVGNQPLVKRVENKQVEVITR